MNIERYQGILEEISSAQTLDELSAMWAMGGDYLEFPTNFVDAVERIKVSPPVVVDLASQLPTPAAEPVVEAAPIVKPVRRSTKKYKLMSLDVSWSTKPQVQAIASILGAHAQVGDVLIEGDIVDMMEANVGVLNTRQGGLKVWRYYAGKSAEGLEMHGNIVEVK